MITATCFAVRLKSIGNKKTLKELNEFSVPKRDNTPVKVGDFNCHYGDLFSWGSLSSRALFEKRGAEQSKSRLLKQASHDDLQVELEVVPVTLSVED